MIIKKKEWKTGYWVALRLSSNDEPFFERFILPYLAFTKWEKSTLASIPAFAGVWSMAFILGWWTFRLRFVIGFTKKLDE